MIAPAPSEVRLIRWQIEIRGAEIQTVEGLAAPYGECADIGAFTETLKPGVFARSTRIANESKSHWTEAVRIPLLVAHDHGSLPVGVAEKWEETNDGLVGTWRLASSEKAQEVRSLIREGMLTQLSVGFIPQAESWDWDRDPKPHVDRVAARLLEVSVVSCAAYEGARITSTRSAGPPTRIDGLPIHVPVGTPFRDEAAAWLRREIERHG